MEPVELAGVAPPVLHGVVADERTILDADRMPLEYVYLTSEVLKVVIKDTATGMEDTYIINDWEDADIKIQAEQMLYIKKQMAQLIAEHTGQTIEQITKDSDRDRWFSAEEAKKYGFVDHVFTSSGQATEGESIGQADAKTDGTSEKK